LWWELLPPGSRDARRGLAGAIRAATDAEIAAAEWAVAADARTSWIELARAERAVDLADRAEDLAEETRSFGRSMLDRGAATEPEVAVLELDVATAHRDAAAARGARSIARERLATAAGLPAGTRPRTVADADPLEPLPPIVPPGDDDDLLLARMPRLAELRARYDEAERELELAHLGALLRTSIGPEVQRDATSTYLGGGATVTIPWTDANRGAIAESEARRGAAARSFEEELYAAQTALTAARADVDAAARALEIHRREVEPAAREALASSERALELGAADLLTTLLARERALRSARASLDLRAAHAIAVARLEAAYGPEPLPTDDRRIP
ncbi:MAG TPA: TolC family protein, partial [Planctomycetota bacterium]|nr:TolC family protein [Planctomycetota bacterium]